MRNKAIFSFTLSVFSILLRNNLVDVGLVLDELIATGQLRNNCLVYLITRPVSVF